MARTNGFGLVMGIYFLIVIMALGVGLFVDFSFRQGSKKPFWELWVFMIPMLLLLGVAFIKGNVNY